MSEILCVNTPSIKPTDTLMTFSCSCGEPIYFDMATTEFTLPFICPKCKESYTKEKVEKFFTPGRKGTIFIPEEMYKEVENNE